MSRKKAASKAFDSRKSNFNNTTESDQENYKTIDDCQLGDHWHSPRWPYGQGGLSSFHL
jgi:hypothetical protein